MSDRARELLQDERRRYIACAVAIVALGGSLLVWPAVPKVRGSLKALKTARSTFRAKAAWMTDKPALEQRVLSAEKRVAEVEAMLVDARGVGAFAQRMARLVQQSGGMIRTVQPVEARTIEMEAGPRRKSKSARPRPVEFFERPLNLSFVADFGQLIALLDSLRKDRAYLQVTKLKVQPNGDDRQTLLCDLEITPYSVVMAPAKES